MKSHQITSYHIKKFRDLRHSQTISDPFRISWIYMDPIKLFEPPGAPAPRLGILTDALCLIGVRRQLHCLVGDSLATWLKRSQNSPLGACGGNMVLIHDWSIFNKAGAPSGHIATMPLVEQKTLKTCQDAEKCRMLGASGRKEAKVRESICLITCP